MPYAASARRPAASSTPSLIITPAPSQPSSPGWNISTTSPRSWSRCCARRRAPPISPAVCRSCPHACMAPLVEAKSSPVSSPTGSASMSARRSTVFGSASSRAPPRRTAVTEVVPVPVEISSPSPSSSRSTFSCVRGRSRPISGSRCSSLRSSARSPDMLRASSYRSTGAPRCRSGQVVGRVRQLDLPVAVPPDQITELVTEVGHDAVSLRRHVLAGQRLVLDRRADAVLHTGCRPTTAGRSGRSR